MLAEAYARWSAPPARARAGTAQGAAATAAHNSSSHVASPPRAPLLLAARAALAHRTAPTRAARRARRSGARRARVSPRTLPSNVPPPHPQHRPPHRGRGAMASCTWRRAPPYSCTPAGRRGSGGHLRRRVSRLPSGGRKPRGFPARAPPPRQPALPRPYGPLLASGATVGCTSKSGRIRAVPRRATHRAAPRSAAPGRVALVVAVQPTGIAPAAVCGWGRRRCHTPRCARRAPQGGGRAHRHPGGGTAEGVGRRRTRDT